MGNERTAEGYAPSNLEPNPVGKPDPTKQDPQLTGMVIDRLRDGIGFPAGVTTIAALIEWMNKDISAYAEAKEAAKAGIVSSVLNELVEGTGLHKDTATIDDAVAWICEGFKELDRLRRLASDAAATQMYAAVEGGSTPTNGKAPTPSTPPSTPYGNVSGGPVSDMLSTLQSSEAQDPDAHHRRDAAAIDDAHTQSFGDNPPGPPPPMGMPPTPYGIQPGDPPFGTPIQPPIPDGRHESEKTRRQHPGPDAGSLHPMMSTFVSEMLAQSDFDAPSAFDILAVCMELAIFLMGKNKQYGDSALDPVRIMSTADPSEQLRVRMDDKLSRMFRGDKQKEDEDVFKDLVGYWVLMRVAEKRAGG